MASYYRRSGRRWYRGGRYYGRNYGYRRKSYKGYGQYKAAKQQADNANVVLSVPAQISCFNKTMNFGTEEQPDLRQVGTYALNVYDLLRKSEFYQSYANMYDEFKIDNVKVKLVPTTYHLTFGDSNVYNSLTVYTAWDRTGLSAEQLALLAKNVTSESDFIGDDTAGNADGIYVAVGDQITTYSSAESRQVSPGSNTSITRWLKPKTMNEKSSWISTSCIDTWYQAWDNTNGRYYGIPIINAPENLEVGKLGTVGGALVNYMSSWSPMTKDNPCFLQESPNIKFKPTLLVSVYPGTTDDSVNNKIGFNIEAEVNVSFRGLRKASIVK